MNFKVDATLNPKLLEQGSVLGIARPKPDHPEATIQLIVVDDLASVRSNWEEITTHLSLGGYLPDSTKTLKEHGVKFIGLEDVDPNDTINWNNALREMEEAIQNRRSQEDGRRRRFR